MVYLVLPVKFSRVVHAVLRVNQVHKVKLVDLVFLDYRVMMLHGATLLQVHPARKVFLEMLGMFTPTLINNHSILYFLVLTDFLVG